MVDSGTSNRDSLARHLRNRLSELDRRLGAVEADLRRAHEPLSPDFAEQASQRENDEVLESLRVSTRTEMQEVRGALERLASGTYGTCAACHGPIESSRLEVLPHVAYCSACAELAIVRL
jgi:DnaK suppressor protein